ncbi:hypothetical protein PZB74_17630 [Porifericola rhodea]|uniref:hypothetical protein n=1 Tax=Porifericola rhodea TaxID=930972 RepID=UPI0026650E11|nr:hypothetical protein [Porifericola rhodea]WKN30779.1 hypothetical protein PZB74_17630 [Porifericola rhodea]
MERFNLYGIQNGKLKHDVHLQAGINKSNIDYLLRNYYYRNEAQLFLQKIQLTLSPTQPFDSLIITRYFADDSTVVARFPQSE